MAKAFQLDFRPVESEHTKALQLKAAEQAKAIEQEQQAATEAEAKRAQDLQARKEQLQEIKNNLSQEDFEQLKAGFEQQILATDFFSKIYKTKGFEYTAIQLQWDNFLAERFLAF